MNDKSGEKFKLAQAQAEEFKTHIISAQQQIETVNKGISGCETALSAMRQQQEEIKGQQSTSKEQYTAQIDSLLTLGVQAVILHMKLGKG
jgi:predicted  nucleic acid-binding Zn-ribbon protein